MAHEIQISVSINKVLLAHSHVHLLNIVCGWFQAITAELWSYNRCHNVHKAWVFAAWLCAEKFWQPLSKTILAPAYNCGFGLLVYIVTVFSIHIIIINMQTLFHIFFRFQIVCFPNIGLLKSVRKKHCDFLDCLVPKFLWDYCDSNKQIIHQDKFKNYNYERLKFLL